MAVLCGYHYHADFMRPLDMAFDWLFFIPNMIIAELIILFLKYQRSKMILV